MTDQAQQASLPAGLQSGVVPKRRWLVPWGGISCILNVESRQQERREAIHLAEETLVTTLDLDRFSTIDRFRKAVASATESDGMVVVTSQGRMLFTAVSPGATKELIADRVALKMAEDDGLLTELCRRLEEEPEPWK